MQRQELKKEAQIENKKTKGKEMCFFDIILCLFTFIIIKLMTYSLKYSIFVSGNKIKWRRNFV